MANELAEEVEATEETEATDKSVSRAGEEAGEESKKGVTSVPYDRFKEIVDVKNTLQQELQSVKGTLEERSQALDRLSAVVQSKEQDSQTIQELRKLAENPKYRDMVLTLDKALKGIEDDVKSGDLSKSEGRDQTAELLQQTREELEGAILDQRAELILARADSMAERYLANLPDDYTDEDKRVISQMWTSEVDWETVERNPNTLPQKLSESLQSVLDNYGTPRGLLAKEATTQTETEADPEPTLEEQLAELTNLDWGKMQAVKTDRGERFEPVVSDEDFAVAAGRALKTANLLRGK